MPLIFSAKTVKFDDICTVEDTMPFFEHLRDSPAVEVDLASCTYMHMALLQLLLRTRPSIVAAPTDPFIVRWLAPLLTAREPTIRSDASAAHLPEEVKI